ncbi:Ima1 N-terminal domain-containing protein [Paraphysoderma sedebokerense]|nr:Ima1 N-terminal domain-containing protein [Paraphysoderma sedebokerense]
MIPREEWYDESLNTDIQKSVSTHHPKQQTTDPVFCDVCITNQRLVTSLLANFVPEDDHPDFLSKDAQVEDYRHRLYQRYPISCEQCQRTVDKKLYHQLHRLKSLLLHANAKRQRMVNSATSSNVFREDTPVIVALSCWIASWIPFCIICSVVGFHSLRLFEQYYSLIEYEFPTYIFPAFYLSSLVVPFLNPLWNLRRNQPHLSSQLKRIRVQHFVIMWIISVIRMSLFYLSTNAYSSKKFLLCHAAAIVTEFIVS